MKQILSLILFVLCVVFAAPVVASETCEYCHEPSMQAESVDPTVDTKTFVNMKVFLSEYKLQTVQTFPRWQDVPCFSTVGLTYPVYEDYVQERFNTPSPDSDYEALNAGHVSEGVPSSGFLSVSHGASTDC